MHPSLVRRNFHPIIRAAKNNPDGREQKEDTTFSLAPTTLLQKKDRQPWQHQVTWDAVSAGSDTFTEG